MKNEQFKVKTTTRDDIPSRSKCESDNRTLHFERFILNFSFAAARPRELDCGEVVEEGLVRVGEGVRHAILHDVDGVAQVSVHFDPWAEGRATSHYHRATAHHFGDAPDGGHFPDGDHANEPHAGHGHAGHDHTHHHG